ncbi:hypothetical protein N0V88_006258 [Collariella sp. IMI 366227]|nr:hypothetical protein N0V88_006258 [Collariella sp. IMI 366227]
MLKLVGLLAAGASVASGSWLPDIITADVAIVGAGASGSYAAIRLKEDFKQSIVVIDKADHLGGHISTYDDPKTGKPFDYGVQTFNDYGPAKAFFERMGIEVSTAPRNVLTSQWADFTTGEPVAFTSPANDARVAALTRFLEVTEPYEQYFLPGYWNFPAPDKIPEDLLLPFNQFVEKYSIQDCVNQVFQVTGMGVGDMANTLTLYVLAAFGQPMIRGFLGKASSFTPNTRRNIALYEAIQARLGDDLLLSTTVVQSLRTPIGHTLWVKNAAGHSSIIIARKLLMAIEPTPANMEPFNLDPKEESVLSKFRYSSVHAGIVAHPSFPINGSVINLPAAAAPSNYLALPKPNFNSRFEYMGQGSDLFRVLMAGDEKFDKAAAQELVRENFAKLVEAGTLPATADPKGEIEFRAWADHGAMHMNVPAAELKAGFIQNLYALQGRRETWWTGGAFSVQFQSILWAFDDILIPKMLAK